MNLPKNDVTNSLLNNPAVVTALARAKQCRAALQDVEDLRNIAVADLQEAEAELRAVALNSTKEVEQDRLYIADLLDGKTTAGVVFDIDNISPDMSAQESDMARRAILDAIHESTFVQPLPRA